MDATDDLASRTGTAIQCVRILYIECAASAASRKKQLVVEGNALQQIPGPLEAQLRIFMKKQVGFIGAAQAMSILDVGSWPAGMHGIVLINAHKKSCREQGDQRGCLTLILRTFDEAIDLSRRFSTTALDIGGTAAAKIAVVEFPDTVIREPGAFPDGSRSCLVADHTQRKLELASLPGVTIIG